MKGAILRLFIACLLLITSVYATKLTQVSKIVGVRDNQLIGYGLVIGLNGTGDGTSSQFTLQSLSNMLQSMNVQIQPQAIKSKNIAAVVITASIDTFARQGDKIDIQVSSIGDAKSLEGGTLLLTPLKGVDGKIYALAQGPLSIGGKNVKGSATQNQTTGGMIYGGATVERELAYDLYNKQYINISLNESSFSNAIATQRAINAYYNTEVAVAIDPKTIKLKRPSNLSMIEFLANLNDIEIMYENQERIVINERTGTIVAGTNLVVDPVVITHGEITIKIEESDLLPEADQNNVALDQGVMLGLQDNKILTKQGSNTIANIARSLQKLGATPKDIISILEAMKKAGAIKAKLEII